MLQMEEFMSTERALFAFAGFMILVSLALTQWVHPNFVWFTAFIGANLFQSAFTGFCPVVMAMKKMGLKTEKELCISKNC